VQDIDVTELAAFLAEHPRAVLLDVREPWEVALASISLPGVVAQTIPMNEVPARLDALPRDEPVVCVCHHGVRSAHVARYLAQAGIEDAINLRGGIDAWSASVDAGVPRY
jgi:rhodanese-related sulfurtransferase